MRESLIDGLIKSIDSRVNAVIAAEGWYTRYSVLRRSSLVRKSRLSVNEVD